MITYFNIKTSYGVETVDELNSNDFNSYKEFKREKERLLQEYHFCNMAVYTSQKCTKDWKS